MVACPTANWRLRKRLEVELGVLLILEDSVAVSRYPAQKLTAQPPFSRFG